MEQLYGKLGVQIPEILLPAKGTDLTKWSVIACDQYTSQPDYWEKVNEEVGDSPSALKLTFPEIYLKDDDKDERIANINETMLQYLKEGILEPQKPGFILVDRSTPHAASRKGLIMALDLECYDYRPGSQTLIRATEGTVLDRIPPRVKIRENAPIELPHIMVLIDDPGKTVIESLFEKKDSFEKLYDFELMQGGGHIRGWKVDDKDSLSMAANALTKLSEADSAADSSVLHRNGPDMPCNKPLLFAMGDGNHSLASAKAHWENVKAALKLHAASDKPQASASDIQDQALNKPQAPTSDIQDQALNKLQAPTADIQDQALNKPQASTVDIADQSPETPLTDSASIPEHPARYALVEVVNVHDEGLVFEPIHRVLFGIDSTIVLENIKKLCGRISNGNAKAEYKLYSSRAAMETDLKAAQGDMAVQQENSSALQENITELQENIAALQDGSSAQQENIAALQDGSSTQQEEMAAPSHHTAENAAANMSSVHSTALKTPHLLPFILEGTYGLLIVSNPPASLEVGTLQGILDELGKSDPTVEIDYIHGELVVTGLGSQKNCMGFYLPVMNKFDFFRTIKQDGILPRKTFSLGEAEEKRYYLECRCIR